MPSVDERETIDRALTGDESAYRRLYRTHRDRIAATIAQRTKDPDDVDDLVQMSFIRAFGALSRFRGDAAFSTWLTRIALNVCITHHQGRRTFLPESALEDAPAVGRHATPEDELVRKERWNAVVAGIDELPPRYRSVMRLHYVEDRPYPELVERLGVPPGTLKTWLHRGRRLVRESLADDDATTP